jgi:hypothetical protein
MTDRLAEIRERLTKSDSDLGWSDGGAALEELESAAPNYATFIAHAPDDIRWIIDRIEELETYVRTGHETRMAMGEMLKERKP